MSRMPAPGEIFAGYRIDRVLGRGDRGVVYLATHPRLPRQDALKVLTVGGDFESTARFVREAELVSRLDHPNIVPLHDRGVDRGSLWIAMGFVDGIDAAELIRRNPAGVPAEQAVHIVTEAARGLDEAHRLGLLHRDVKPANILLEPRTGLSDRVYVSDFGTARPTTDTEALTEDGSLVATLAYAAPELLSAASIDHRVDVYALGCTLYELLTGTTPFPGASPAASIRAHISEPPPSATTRNPTLPAAIDAVIGHALAKDPQRRYESCGALAAAAAAALAGRAVRPARRWWRVRGRVALTALLTVAALVVTGAVVRNTDRSTGPSETPPTVPATAQATSTAESPTRSWGAYSFVIDAFPDLLPPTPLASGYQSIRCVPLGDDGSRIELTQPLGALAGLRCGGNGDPMEWLFIHCAVDRSPMLIDAPNGATDSGERRWDHPTGGGRMAWRIDTGPLDRRMGLLEVQFDNPARNFCRFDAWGGATGRDLVDRWWPTVPL